MEAQYDHHGNAISYKYKPENDDNVDPLFPYECGRIKKFTEEGFAQKYPERIQYGNSNPVWPDEDFSETNKWLFEVVFDYGAFENRPYTDSFSSADRKWLKRADPYSVYHTGFEIRTYRLCQRLLLYHQFEELGTASSLTGIFACTYQDNPLGTTLQSVAYTGVRRDLSSGTYSEKTLPKLVFHYSKPELGKSFQASVKETNENLPQGLNDARSRVIDLFGEGIPGILTETANTWYFKPNLGDGKFGKQQTVIHKPNQQAAIYALGDFDKDGNINLFSLRGRTAGYYEYDRERESWSGFTPFPKIPQVDNAKFLDVNADGFPDLVVERADKIICYPFKGKDGFDTPYEFSKPRSNGRNYAPTIGDNPILDYFLADMTGDGLPDQVSIKNGRVAYYPNLGNGQFGEMVLMENAPVIDFDTEFDASRIRLYDLDGSGTTDILYLGKGEIRYWYNASGNQFIKGGTICNLPYIDNISTAFILDFLGNGTPCLVWSSSLNHLHYSSVQYLELTNGVKPRLLTSLENSMGKEVKIKYGYSGRHYLSAKKTDSPWISKLPSHFTVVDQKIVIDHITKTNFTTQYKYRDGHYDGKERRFVTFGLVEEYDTELYESVNLTHDNDYVQPSCLKTWFHNGLFGWEAKKDKAVLSE